MEVKDLEIYYLDSEDEIRIHKEYSVSGNPTNLTPEKITEIATAKALKYSNQGLIIKSPDRKSFVLIPAHRIVKVIRQL